MLRRGLFVAAMILACLSLGGRAQSAEPSMQEVLDRLKAVEEKNKDLESKLSKAQAIAERRPSADAQVDKALRRAGDTITSVITEPDPNCRPLVIGGYLDFSYQYNLTRPDNFNNNLRVFDKDSNGFNVHQAELNFSRLPTKPGEAGFRMDLQYGTDQRVFSALDNTTFPPERGTQFKDVDLQQAYISYIVPVGCEKGITLDFGKFVTWSGTEVIEASDNDNASRSNLFGYAIPFTHTGVRATYDVFTGGECGGSWKVGLGIVNGWDNIQDQNNAKTLMWLSDWKPNKWFQWVVTGSLGDESYVDERLRLAGSTAIPTLLAPDGGDFAGEQFSDLSDATIPGVGFTANGGIFDSHDSSPRLLLDTTLNFFPTDDLTFRVNVDYGTEGSLPNGFSGRGSRSWFGVAGYAKWQFNCNWYLALRGDYFNDKDGARTGTKQDLVSGTVTLDYKVADPFHIRFEYRHDRSNNDSFSDSRGISNAFDATDPNLRKPFHSATQDTVMMQFLYKF